jgi:hypothetical protein
MGMRQRSSPHLAWRIALSSRPLTGTLVKRLLAPLTLMAACALVATQASAQSPTPQTRKAAPAAKTVKAPPKAQKTITAAAPAHATAATVTVSAAASVILLADGIVANAATAQILPPAEGFVYER